MENMTREELKKEVDAIIAKYENILSTTEDVKLKESCIALLEIWKKARKDLE